jgi:aminopeptidase YwaD
MIRFLTILLFSLSFSLTAQTTLEKARQDIEILSSREFFGRGYTHGGHIKAANYIKEELSRLPNIHIETQTFHLKTNLIRKAPNLTINGVEMTLGTDFLPHGYCGSGRLTPDMKTNDFGGDFVASTEEEYTLDVDIVGAKIAIIDKNLSPAKKNNSNISKMRKRLSERIQSLALHGARAILIRTDKLLYARAHSRLDVPVFYVLEKHLPKQKPIAVSASVESRLTTIETQNVVVTLKGQSQPDSIIVITAHYDHMGGIGDTVFFPGANDNASGTAMVMALMRHFSKNPMPFTLKAAFFSGEELGLLGSKHMAVQPPFDLENVKFLLNLDMVASGTKGIVAVGGSDFPHYFNLLKTQADRIGLDYLGKRPNVPNSDHFPFVDKGVKGFFLYTNQGKQPYHSVDDIPATLDWDTWAETYHLAEGFIAALTQPATPGP